ncbi:MAG: alpha/beta hydrolase [Candidatus Lokiarchaeota archaeon]|nr:alpha/beta hydrolase [Candidatus Lokiarchaeota archaeon]
MKTSDKIRRLVPILVIVATCTCLGLHLGLSFGPAGVEKVSIVDSGDGWVVKGDLYVPRARAAPLPAVILSHGDGVDRSQMTQIATAIAEKGIVVLNIDLSGYGESPNWWSTQNHLHDYNASYNYLAGRSDVAPALIAAVGFSRGGQAALWSPTVIPVKHVVSLGYTWDSYAFNASYPANVMFITGVDDEMMYPHVHQIMQVMTGLPAVDEGIVYGSISTNTARVFKTFNCGHGDTVVNAGVIDETAMWLDRSLNGNDNPAPSTATLRYTTQFAAIAGVALVAAWLAFMLGKRIHSKLDAGGGLVVPQAGPSTDAMSRPTPSEVVVKGIVFLSLYVACWVPVFVLHYVNLASTWNIYSVSANLSITFPFITGRQANEVLAILLFTTPQLILIGLLARSLFQRIEHGMRKAVIVQNPDSQREPVPFLPLREPGDALARHLAGGGLILGTIAGGLVLALQFTLYKIVPENSDQWFTFLLLLPFTLAFSLGDQVWFGAVVQRKSAYQQNRKVFLALLAAFLMKAAIIGVFLAIGSINYILPLVVLLVLSLPFNFWLTQFFKSIYPGALVTGTLMALVIPMLSIV